MGRRGGDENSKEKKRRNKKDQEEVMSSKGVRAYGLCTISLYFDDVEYLLHLDVWQPG